MEGRNTNNPLWQIVTGLDFETFYLPFTSRYAWDKGGQHWTELKGRSQRKKKGIGLKNET